MGANGAAQVRATRPHQPSPPAAAPAPEPAVAVGEIVRYVLESDGEHEPVVRAAVVVSAAGLKANLAVFIDGDADYKYIEIGNAQVSAANREGALITALRRTGVAFDREGLRAGTWHWAAT